MVLFRPLCPLKVTSTELSQAGLFDVLESLGFSLRQELVNDDLKRDLIEKARGVVKDGEGRGSGGRYLGRPAQFWKDWRLQQGSFGLEALELRLE